MWIKSAWNWLFPPIPPDPTTLALADMRDDIEALRREVREADARVVAALKAPRPALPAAIKEHVPARVPNIPPEFAGQDWADDVDWSRVQQ